MNRYTESELIELAKTLGATHSRLTFSEDRYVRGKVNELARHYFNSNDEEVCNYVVSEQLYQLTGMQVFEKPRIWSDKNKLHYLTGEPVDFNLIVAREFSKNNIFKSNL